MTIHKGKVNSRQLANLFHTVLLAEGYTEHSSEIGTDGRVYRSPSVNGEDLFFIQLKDLKGFSFQVGVYEMYTANATHGLPGTFLNGVIGSNSIIWNAGNTADRMDVSYVINVTKERMIVYVEGQRAETGFMNSLTYLGLPKRSSSNDKFGTFAGIANTAYGNYSVTNTFHALRNRPGTPAFPYNLDFYMPKRSYGWGGRLFFSPIFIGSKVEGTRGILDGILIAEKTDALAEISHGDTFPYDGKNYMLIVPTVYGNGTLNTANDYLIEI